MKEEKFGPKKKLEVVVLAREETTLDTEVRNFSVRAAGLYLPLP